MLQRLLAWIIVLVSILWIVVSYLPTVQAAMPMVAPMSGALPAWLGITSLAIFLGIQLWLIKTTGTAIQSYRSNPEAAPFRLRLGRELFWTALPVLMTLVLAWASLVLWRNLAIP